jgi:hypothetical protein
VEWNSWSTSPSPPLTTHLQPTLLLFILVREERAGSLKVDQQSEHSEWWRIMSCSDLQVNAPVSSLCTSLEVAQDPQSCDEFVSHTEILKLIPSLRVV